MDSTFGMEYSMLSCQRALKEASSPGDSPVQKFYEGCTVFITGGSGFLGKLLIEKLLRTCSPSKIYVLIRQKKGKSPKKRVEETLKDPLFDVLRKQQQNFDERIFPVEGDISELKLGLKDCEWNMISKEVNVIFHLAANVRFDVELKWALLSNARGTREALRLAGDCTQLRAFVYVSTAYTHATRDRINDTVSEIFYDAPAPPDAMIELAETLSVEKLDKMKSTIIEGWPNTYTFSKAIAEEIVRANVMNLPICVVRPAIGKPLGPFSFLDLLIRKYQVISTYREPIPGWLDLSCAYGPSGLILGSGIGLIHTIYMDITMRADLVPADIVNNSIILAAYETARRSKKSDQLMIYTVSSNRNQITYGTIHKTIDSLIDSIAFFKAIWYVFYIETKYKILYNIMSVFLHYIPAYIVDGVCLILRKPPMFRKIYRKADNLGSALSYFTINQWTFKDDNLQSLYKNQSPTDKKIFDIDIIGVDWRIKIYFWCIGVIKYLVKDNPGSMIYAVRKQKVLKIIHYIVSALYIFLMWKLVKFCFNLFFYFAQVLL